MPHATETDYQHISVEPVGRTFGAEVSGVDFSKPVPDDVFQEILSAITKVSQDIGHKPSRRSWVSRIPTVTFFQDKT
jgi:hypothetical protein